MLLVFTLPYSNEQLYEAMMSGFSESLCTRLAEAFSSWGRVPSLMALDNAIEEWPPPARGRGRVQVVAAAQEALLVPGEVLQPLLEQREGFDGERRRVPPLQHACLRSLHRLDRETERPAREGFEHLSITS